MRIGNWLAGTVAICAAGGAAAANFTWQGAADARWDEKSSYVEDAVPAAGDTVTVPKGCNPVVDDDDFALVSSLRDVVLVEGCTITFTVTTDKTLNCAVHQPDSDISSYARNVTAIKTGAGKLTLAAPTMSGAVSNASYIYRVSWRIDGGSLAFADNQYNGVALSIVGLDLAGGTIFDIGGCDRLNVGRLFGAGTITNRATNAMLYIQRDNNTSEFSGRITGDIELRAAPNGGRVTLTGTESDFSLFNTYADGVTVFIQKFGNEGEPSSIGTNGTIGVLKNGARLVYLGAGGETCNKALSFAGTAIPVTLDGGATGGIEFSGMFGNYTGHPTQRRMEFDGSNQTECVFSGQYVERDRNGTNYCTFITKKGTGIWRFANHSKRSNLGVVAVDEGTLRFDSLAEAGKICSLGKATELYDDHTGNIRLDEWAVPYALRVGGGETEGVFEYTGAEAVRCSTRPLAVMGDGRLRNVTDCNFDFTGVFGIGDGAKTLTLDGNSTVAYNRLETVTNACGTLSLAKDGDGTWILAGDQSFNGRVDVRRGTLKVLREPTYATWFKFVVKQSYHLTLAEQGIISKGASKSREFQVQELAFYDADGIRRNLGITLDESVADLTTLSTGKVAYASGRSNRAERGPSLLFDDLFTGTGWHGTSNFDSYMVTNVAASWVQLVMRLPDESPEIVAYDFAHATAPNTTSDRQIYAYAIEGSSDGVHWTELTNVVGVAATDQYHWNSNNGTPTAGETLGADRGFPLNTRLHDSAPSVFNNVTSVSVAPGATLVAEIRDGGAPIVLKGLTVDPTATGEPGVIDGFAFAERGTINLTSLTDRHTTLPLRLENATGVANIAGWDTERNGRPTARFKVSADPATGTITVSPIGTYVIIR